MLLISQAQVTNLADHLRQTRHQLLHQYEQELCVLVGENLSTDRQLVSDIAYLYDIDFERFLKFACPVILPHLIVQRKRAGLDTLVDILHTRLSDLCIQHSFPIARHLLTQSPEDIYNRAVDFFELITDSYIGIQELIDLCEVRLVQNLALEFSDSTSEVQVKSSVFF